MKKILPILSILLLGTVAFARVHAYWSYDKLTKEADLIVIATPISVQDTAERTTFPDIVQTDTNNVRRPVPAIGVETTFAVLSVLKGNTSTNTFAFHYENIHYTSSSGRIQSCQIHVAGRRCSSKGTRLLGASFD